MTARPYQIIDEPKPTGLSTFAVQPLWPLLATMLAGAVPGFAFFIFNGFAVGSATKGRDIAWCAAGLAGLAILATVGLVLLGNGYLSMNFAPYWFISISVWRLYVGYRLFLSQEMAFELHQYFGGPVRNGVLALVALVFLFGRVPWPDEGLLRLVELVWF